MDRRLMKDIRGVIEAAIMKEAESFRLMGVAVTVGRGSYNPSNGSVKIEIADVVGGQVKTKEAVTLEQNAQFLGLPADILGKPVKIGDKVFTIEGMTRGDSVVLKKVPDGKMFKAPMSMVKQALGVRTLPQGVSVVSRHFETADDLAGIVNQ